MSTGKKYIESAKLIDRTKLYDTDEALSLVCQTEKAKFDETVEVHVRLGVDSRHADQQVRGAVVLPNGTGKTVRTKSQKLRQSKKWIKNDISKSTKCNADGGHYCITFCSNKIRKEDIQNCSGTTNDNYPF